MLLGGRLSDTFGRKRILNLSLMLFGIGSLLAGIAWTAAVMIAARFIQGVGSAILAPTSLALIMDYFEGAERVKAVAWYSSISIGPLFRSCLRRGDYEFSFVARRFSGQYPVHRFHVGRFRQSVAAGRNEKRAVRYMGHVAVGYRNFRFRLCHQRSTERMAMVVCRSVGIGRLCPGRSENGRTDHAVAVVPQRDTLRAYAARAMFVGAMMGFNFTISEYMQEVYGFTPLLAGVGFLPMTVFTFLTAIEVPRLVGKHGNRHVLAVGLMCMLIGFAWLSLLNAGSPYLTGIALPMIVLGIGNGLTLSPLTNLGIEHVEPNDAGAASGLVNAAHQIGGAIGLSVMVAAGADASDMAARCRIGMIIATIFIVTAFVVTFVRLYQRKQVGK